MHSGDSYNHLMIISLVIGTHNEGDMLAKTIASARATMPGIEIVVADDASTDGSCGPELDADQMVRHKERIGVAQSRIDGGDAASGDVIVFCDGHHTFEPGCIEQTAKAALDHRSIVWPCLHSLDTTDHGHTHSHGAYMAEQTPETKGYKYGGFGVAWEIAHLKPGVKLRRCGGMFVPYAIPKTVWPVVRWPTGCRGNGHTETNLMLKAWFSEVQVLHMCGPFSSHLFRKKHSYKSDSRDHWINHAIGCRVCFDDATWHAYLFPHVFKRVFPEDIFSTDELITEGEAWRAAHKKRPDWQFWTGLMDRPSPEGVIRT